MEAQIIDNAVFSTFKELEKMWIEEEKHYSLDPWVMRGQINALLSSYNIQDIDDSINRLIKTKILFEVPISRDRLLIRYEYAIKSLSLHCSEALLGEASASTREVIMTVTSNKSIIDWVCDSLAPYLAYHGPQSVSSLLSAIGSSLTSLAPPPLSKSNENDFNNTLIEIRPIKKAKLEPQDYNSSLDYSSCKTEITQITNVNLITHHSYSVKKENNKLPFSQKRSKSSAILLDISSDEECTTNLHPISNFVKSESSENPLHRNNSNVHIQPPSLACPPLMRTASLSAFLPLLLSWLKETQILKSFSSLRTMSDPRVAFPPLSIICQAKAIHENRKNFFHEKSVFLSQTYDDILGRGGFFWTKDDNENTLREENVWLFTLPKIGLFERQLIDARKKFAASIIRFVKKDEFFFKEVERLTPPKPTGLAKGLDYHRLIIQTNFLIRDFISIGALAVIERPQGNVLVKNLVKWGELFSFPS